jgi:alkylation response protein AidB-like acyl-CoA dehydrogenase
MDLTPTEDQRMIAESAEAYLAEACTMVSVCRHADEGDGFDAALWQGIAELGWCGLRLPEAVGGLGLGWVEQALLHEQLGRHLACVPFLEGVALSTTVLQLCAPQPVTQALWTALATGSRRLACALPIPAPPDQAAAVDPVPPGNLGRVHGSTHGLALGGQWHGVGAAAHADLLLLPAQDDNGAIRLLLVPGDAPGLVRTPLEPTDGTRPLADVTARAVHVPHSHCLATGLEARALLERARCLAAIALAAEQLGTAQAAFDRTLAYVQERSQFDRPIARFQAIKHRCAQLLVLLETARSAVYGAACLADTGPDDASLLLHAAQARDAATEAALATTREAIQLHGGVGFTWAFDLHRFLRRAQVDSHCLGGQAWWREQVAVQLLDGKEPGG